MNKKHIFLISSLLFIILVSLGILIKCQTNKNSKIPPKDAVIREPVVAGAFYPGQPKELVNTIKGFSSIAKPTSLKNIKAIIAPHAGYIYSGQVAAHAYKSLKKQYKKIFIIGSNHSERTPNFLFSTPAVEYYRTPLGIVKLSSISKKLLQNRIATSVPEAHSTHIIEVHLPFLQLTQKDFEIIPIVTGNARYPDIQKLANFINQHYDDNTLIIISSDLSHYHPYDKAVALDSKCIKAIEKQNIDSTIKCEACGQRAILVLLELARIKGWVGKILDYKNSGDTAGTKDRVVGYSSIIFHNPDLLETDKKELLKLSRKALTRLLNKKKETSIAEVSKKPFSEAVFKKQGCFVTLEKKHQLRGCIGHIAPQTSIIDCVLQCTASAALRDRRFKPVTKDELKDIDIEISVLTTPKAVPVKGPKALLEFLVPKKHGVILRQGQNSSTYLPQVWNQLPEKTQFLGRLCMKAGLDANCWQAPKTQIFTYKSILFKEHP